MEDPTSPVVMEASFSAPEVSVPAAVRKKVEEILQDPDRPCHDVKDMFARSKVVTIDDVTDDHVARAYKIQWPSITKDESAGQFCFIFWACGFLFGYPRC